MSYPSNLTLVVSDLSSDADVLIWYFSESSMTQVLKSSLIKLTNIIRYKMTKFHTVNHVPYILVKIENQKISNNDQRNKSFFAMQKYDKK